MLNYSIRTNLIDTDPAHIAEITASTGFFRPDEVDMVKEMALSTINKTETYRYILVDVDGKLAGYACYDHVAGTIGSYDFYFMSVSKSLQGKGIGKLMINKLEHDVKADGGRHIYIDTSNTPLYQPTRDLYVKLGYEKVAELPDFYIPGDGKITYRKIIG